MKKNETKLYNMLFPVWLFFVLPIAWIVVLPGNFIIDLLVIVIAMKIINIQDIKHNAKKIIIRTWLCGFVADIIGALFMVGVSNIEAGEGWYNNVVYPIQNNPFLTIAGFLFTTLAALISAIIIYVLNYKFCFNKSNLNKSQKKKLALSLAIFTAPYLFYVPSQVLF